MKKTMVLYPGLAVSHFLPMMQLADELLGRGYAVAVALIDPAAHQQVAFTATVDRVVSSKKHAIRFHVLPRPRVERLRRPPPATTTDRGDFSLLGYLDLVKRHNRCLHGFLASMPLRDVHALVVDSLSVDALDVAQGLGVPGYVFHPGNAGAFAIFLQLSLIRREGRPSFRELGDTPLELPGLPSMPASHLWDELLEDPESEVYSAIMALGRKNSQYCSGILVNTFESLEPRVASALRGSRGGGGGGPALPPPFYCVGPLVEKPGERDDERRHECLAWLDGQPDRSVVFLCFGSTGSANHSAEQLREIAVGLERSGHRFLWVVRAPVSTVVGGGDPYDPRAEPDLDALLPAGFLHRTSGRSAVVKLWAPQVEVLRHRATAAFVTHCGWNSVLEGVAAGVPMLCWPLHAEQRMNKALMVAEAEMGVAVEMAGWQWGLVAAEEVERRVRQVMESEAGGELRARVAAQKAAAAAAWADGGGSSRAAFSAFLSDVDKRQLAR